MTPRTRVWAFGCAALLVLAGVACAVLLGGLTGEILALVLIAAGFGAGLLLVFAEIGFGEERELAREERMRREQERRRVLGARGAWIRRPRHPRRPR